MKALTIRQPYAAAIAHLGKAVENRSWVTSFRGLVAIHAGSGVGAKWEYEDALEHVAAVAGISEVRVSEISAVRGAVVAVATLTDVCSELPLHLPLHLPCTGPPRCNCGRWAAHQSRHFKLGDIRPLAEPVPVKGALGLWTLPDEVEKAVRAQLAEVTA